jgi:hypothetical protein
MRLKGLRHEYQCFWLKGANRRPCIKGSSETEIRTNDSAEKASKQIKIVESDLFFEQIKS